MKTMRDAFLERFTEIAKADRNVVLLCNDFGAPALDRFRAELPRQFIHIGIAEENLVNAGAGLAMAGKQVYLYSIAPFVPLRCFEQIKVHMGFRGFNMNAVVVGAGFSYDKSGPTHHSLEDVTAVGAVPGVEIWTPSDAVLAEQLAVHSLRPGPKYFRFDREAVEDLYTPKEDFSRGFSRHGTGTDLVIVATGTIVHQALQIAKALKPRNVDVSVIDLFRPKPLDADALLAHLKPARRIATLEEHFLHGGLGDSISGLLHDHGLTVPLKRLGVPEQYFFEYGGREALRKAAGLDLATLIARLA